MTLEQWNTMKAIVAGDNIRSFPVALLVDSPWIAPYQNISTIDYLTDPQMWFQANKNLVEEFPEIIFVPGFWVEMGMAAEPSGFGCKINFYNDKTPTVRHLFSSPKVSLELEVPNPLADGLMPIILNYFQKQKKRVEGIGHPIKIVSARGPLATASHLMGVTDFLLGLKLEPDNIHYLLKITTKTTINWLEAQSEAIGNVEAIWVLDDIMGFLSDEDYREFVHPYFKAIFDYFPHMIKFLHNDTDNPVCYPYLEELGVDIFNFSHKCSMMEAREKVGDKIVLLGNIPPLEGLAEGTPQMVESFVKETLDQIGPDEKVIISAGGGVSPGTTKQNIEALVQTVNNYMHS